MTHKHYQVDPENIEIETLLTIAGERIHKRVLEIGCGDGRLTWGYAHLAREIVGLDPDAERIAIAKQNTPPADAHRLHFTATDILSFHHREPFDLALLSWSL